MRKLISFAVSVTALAGASVALAGQGATNKNGDFIALSVAATPPVAGTATTPRGVGVSFDSFAGNRIHGNVPSVNTSITVRFNKGFKWNGKLFPACRINLKALTRCPKSSRIGTGTGEAQLAGSDGAPPTFIPAKLRAYNGKPLRGKAPTLIFIGTLNGRPATEVDFTVKQQPRGPYGLAFRDIHFPNSAPSPFDITKFSVTIPDKSRIRKAHGRSVEVHLIEAPATCHRSWKFAQTDTFSDAAPLTATDSQPCLKR
jgi:hypothetical protein